MSKLYPKQDGVVTSRKRGTAARYTKLNTVAPTPRREQTALTELWNEIEAASGKKVDMWVWQQSFFRTDELLSAMRAASKAPANPSRSYTGALRDGTATVANPIQLAPDESGHVFATREVEGLDHEFKDDKRAVDALYFAQVALYLSRERCLRLNG